MTRQPNPARPPRVARALVALATPEFDRAFVLADLDEEYARLRGGSGWWAARLWYWRQTLDAVRAGLGRRLTSDGRRWEHRTGPASWQIECSQACRYLIRRPGFAVVTALTLAIGLGTTAVILHGAYATLVKPLPYPEPSRLMVVVGRAAEDVSLARAELYDLRTRLPVFSSVGAYDEREAYLVGGAEPQWVQAAAVTPDLLSLLGLVPAYGRTFLEAEGRAPSAVVMLGYELWRRQFGGDPAVVGTPVELDGESLTIVGVTPEGFRLPAHLDVDNPAEVWRPLVTSLDDATAPRPLKDFDVIARLAPQATPAAAQAAVADLSHLLRRQFPDVYGSDPPWHLVARPLSETVNAGLRPGVFLLAGAAVCLLLLVVVNAAGLVLVRNLARRDEMRVRLALGAGVWRLFRQALWEGALLGATGGLIGLGLAWALLSSLFPISPLPMQRADPAAASPVVALLAAGLSVLVGTGIGALSAVQMRALQASDRAMAAGRWTPGRRSGRALGVLLVTEVALSLVLAAGAGLMGGSLWRLYRVDPGFDPTRVVAVDVSLPRPTHPDAADMSRYFEDALAAVRALGVVESAGAVRRLPIGSRIGRWSLRLSRTDEAATGLPEFQVVTPGYFETIRVPLLSGRFPSAADRSATPGVVVVNAAMAAEYWPGEDAVGRELRLDGHPDNPWVSVVGVVGNVRSGLRVDNHPRVYLPHDQSVTIAGPFMRTSGLTLVARLAPAGLATAADAVRATLLAVDSRVPIGDVRTMDDVVRRSLGTSRFLSTMFIVLTGFALLLAATGIGGAVSVAVRQRTREIGIRLALGARTGHIEALMLRRTLALVACGLAAGVLGSWWLAPALQSFVFGIRPHDIAVLTAATIVVAAVAVGAGWWPARRATRTDPVAALRDT